jgi:X-Pro dipeptidyl-peptidase
MSKVKAIALAVATAASSGLLLSPRLAAHAATAPIPANPCAAGSDAQCRDYIVPTTWLDPSGQPVNIFLEVEHATDASGNIIPAPLILTYSPYSILGRNGGAPHWNALGYSRAYADVVGTGNSGGCWDYGGQAEKQTAYDVIEAIAAQPWSNGKIGMLGGSYDGTTQYAAAVMHPPHLVTIVPEAAIDRWYDYAFANGVRYFYTTEPFGYEGPGTAGDEGIDTPLGFDFGLAIPPPADNTDPTWAQRLQSHFNVCQQVEHTMEGYSTTPDYTQFWLDRDYLKDLPTVTIPVLVASNFGDWNVKQVDGWQAYHALTHSSFARMYFGSRWHGHGVPPNATGFNYISTVDAWFAHWLQGANNGLESMPQVTTATTDSSGPTHDHYTAGPEPNPAQIPLYLEHNGDGTWALSPDAASAPAGSPQAVIDWTGTNTETNDVLHPYTPDSRYLSFTSPVLTQDVRIYGEPVLHLWSTIQRSWITYTPRLVDFDPSKYTGSGTTTESTTANAIPAMTRGWMDTRYRDGLASEVSVTPSTPFATDISLWPQDYTVRAGHRLILILSTETTDWDVPKFSTSTDLGAPTAQIDYEQSQSYITLPLVGVSSGDSIFNGPQSTVPEVPVTPMLVTVGFAGAVVVARRRRSRART